ncbi:hypothetical protein RJ639_023743 [Escallonia herrerae]|uniref:Zinc finger, CCHC-type n=1 Tax=Escallonia herrerae TaxID=1293975 RepID=A0AA89AFF8_9ASTE|nr:hypothetical protein RJ639_023743 [Escallonia herrerae]
MHFLLVTVKVYYVIVNPRPPEPGENEEESVAKTRERLRWDQDDEICRGHILNGMSNTLFDAYHTVKTAKELWNQLERRYITEDATSKRFIVSKFFDYKMVDGRSVMEQFNEIKSILHPYSQHKLALDEFIVVTSIIDKLPPSWKNFRNNLKHRKEDINLDELGTHLRIEEDLRKEEKSKSEGEDEEAKREESHIEGNWKMKVYYVIVNPRPPEPGENEEESVAKTRERLRWDQDDEICRGHILNGMSNTLFDAYHTVKTAKELWNQLERRYITEDATSKRFIVSKFFDYKMVDGRSVMEQFNEIKSILDRYSQHKLALDEFIVVTSIIDKLPPSWKNFRNNLKHRKEDINLDELGTHLRIEEDLRKEEKSKSEGEDEEAKREESHIEGNWKMKVYYVIVNPRPPEPGENEEESVAKTRERLRWDQDDEICRGHILNGMSNTLFDAYHTVKTAKELWNQLERRYITEDATSKRFIVSKFFDYKMVDGRSVMEQFNEIKSILDRYSQHKLALDEFIVVTSIIDKLPPSWKNFRNNLKHRKEDINLDELGTHLRIEEDLRKEEKSKSEGEDEEAKREESHIEGNWKSYARTVAAGWFQFGPDPPVES